MVIAQPASASAPLELLWLPSTLAGSRRLLYLLDQPKGAPGRRVGQVPAMVNDCITRQPCSIFESEHREYDPTSASPSTSTAPGRPKPKAQIVKSRELDSMAMAQMQPSLGDLQGVSSTTSLAGLKWTWSDSPQHQKMTSIKEKVQR
ncbi:hypothetical protein C8R47DRAFT_1073676 [Mycena vitilis]|nr:hypothetical protein C8R47DRAFT_1073676 [Mycena vitilis]